MANVSERVRELTDQIQMSRGNLTEAEYRELLQGVGLFVDNETDDIDGVDLGLDDDDDDDDFTDSWPDDFADTDF